MDLNSKFIILYIQFCVNIYVAIGDKYAKKMKDVIRSKGVLDIGRRVTE